MTADVPAAEAMDVDKPEPSGKSSGEGEARTEPAASDGQNLVDALRQLQLEDDPSSEEDEDLAAGGGKKKVLVGGEGADFVAAELGRNPDVADAIKRIQDQGALKTVGIDRESDAEPLLGLLGQLGMTRAEVYRHTLDDALKELRDRIDAMPQGTLLSLLDASFAHRHRGAQGDSLSPALEHPSRCPPPTSSRYRATSNSSGSSPWRSRGSAGNSAASSSGDTPPPR